MDKTLRFLRVIFIEVINLKWQPVNKHYLYFKGSLQQGSKNVILGSGLGSEDSTQKATTVVITTNTYCVLSMYPMYYVCTK